ncbi:MAG: stage III sporulation protein AB [Acutalibacter sp.]|jgi:stage III sporulation protein AB
MRLRRRARLLLDWKAMLQRFQTGIRYAAESLPEMILELESSRFCRLAEQDGEFLMDPAGALERAGRALLWDKGDLELYLNFVQGLGVTDTQGQLEHIGLYTSLLEPRLVQAREEAGQKAKISVALGLFAGTAIALLLL